MSGAECDRNPGIGPGRHDRDGGSSTHFAETCTALGFSLWLTILALAYVYIFRISGWHAVLLVLSAPVIAYLVNLLCAFTLVLNPAMEVLMIHTLQGVVFFLIGFSLLYATVVVLMRQFRHQTKQAGGGGDMRYW